LRKKERRDSLVVVGEGDKKERDKDERKRQFSLGWKHHPGLKILSRVVFPPDTTKV
jgi:hypothetical protein